MLAGSRGGRGNQTPPPAPDAGAGGSWHGWGSPTLSRRERGWIPTARHGPRQSRHQEGVRLGNLPSNNHKQAREPGRVWLIVRIKYCRALTKESCPAAQRGRTMGPGAGCRGQSSGAGGHGGGRQPGPPGPQLSPGSPPASRRLGVDVPRAGVGAIVHPLAGTEGEQGLARPLASAWLPLGVKSCRSQRPPGEPRYHQDPCWQHPASARAGTPAEPGILVPLASPRAEACWLQHPAPAPVAGRRVHRAGGAGGCSHPLGKQPWKGIARAHPCTRRHVQAHTDNHMHTPVHARRHACAHAHTCADINACAGTQTSTRTHTHAHARAAPRLQTSCWPRRWWSRAELLSSIAQPFPARTQPPAEQPAAPSGGAGDVGVGRESTRSWAWMYPTSQLACPGTGTPARRGTIWSADASKTSNGPRKLGGGSALSRCPEGLRHPAAHGWGCQDPPGPWHGSMRPRSQPSPSPGTRRPPAGAGQRCRWVCRPTPGSPRSSKPAALQRMEQ